MQNFIKTIINAIKFWIKEQMVLIEKQIKIQVKNSTADWNQNDSSVDSYIKNRPFYEEDGIIHKLDPKYLPDNIGGVQSDWDQNDPEAKDYIKNRPFYEERIETTWISEQVITVNKSGYADLVGNYEIWPSIGDPYKVIFDGVEYTGTTWEDSDICTRTDFVTQDGISVTIYDGQGFYSDSSLAGEHTIAIYYYAPFITKISEKYLPDDVLMQSDWNETNRWSGAYIKNKPEVASRNELISIRTDMNAPRSCITLKDFFTGRNYALQVENGELTLTSSGTLEDFSYILNDDGTYTIKTWQRTYYGEPSTEMIFPHGSHIII